jgi:S-adenosylmethionine synthetase
MGRMPQTVTKTFKRPGANGIEKKEMTVELFTWEKLDSTDAIRGAFGL